MFKLLVVLAIAAVAVSEARLVRPLLPPAVAKRLGSKVKLIDDTKIIGGDFAVRGEFPHQIALYSTFLGIKTFLCGASLIAADKVLTAGHCVQGQLAIGISAKAGELHLDISSGDEQEITAKRIIRHPEHNLETFENDIAIIVLNHAFTLNNETARIIELPEQGAEHEDGVTCVVTGWGSTTQGGVLARRLHKVEVPYVNDEDCNAAYGTIVSSMMCAGVKDKDACQGDSGGPIICNNNKVLSGVVSWGNGCALEGYPGVYSQVSYFRDWIESHL